MSYLWFLGGVFVGTILTYIRFGRVSRKGILKIDRSDPEKDIYRIDLDGVVLNRTKRLILKIDHNADLSQN